MHCWKDFILTANQRKKLEKLDSTIEILKRAAKQIFKDVWRDFTKYALGWTPLLKAWNLFD